MHKYINKCKKILIYIIFHANHIGCPSLSRMQEGSHLPWVELIQYILRLIVKNTDVERNRWVQRRTVKEETAVRGELPILWRWDGEAMGIGQEGGVRFTHHIECEKEGECRHSQVSVLYVMQGRSERAQMGNQNDWIIESLKNRTSVITNLD